MSFDPTQPFEVEGGFDPSLPFEVESQGPKTRSANPNRYKSTGELVLGGARKFLGDISLGAGQVATAIPALLGSQVAKDEQAKLERIADVRKLDPVMRTGAGQAGYLGAAFVPALAAGFVPGANTVAGAGLIGGGMGLMQPTGADDSRAANAAIGAASGAGGQAAFNVVGRIAQPVKTALNRAESRAVALLKSKGVNLSVGQQTGSRAAQTVERTLNDIPASAPAMVRQGERFRDSYTRAVLKTVGENADTATPEVLGRAQTRIGKVFDDVASKYGLKVTDPAVAAKLTQLEFRAADELLNDQRIGTQIQRIREAAKQNGGRLDGKAYQNVKTTLDNLSRQQNIGPLAAELREVLDDALYLATKGTSDFARLKEARAQYRNLMAIADVADTTANGRVSPAALASRLKSNKYTRNSMRFDKGDAELARLARAGSTVVDRFPQSGTTPRAAAQLMLPAVAGGASYLADNDLGNAAKLAATVWGIPKLGAWAMTNPGVQNYLSQGIGQNVVRNALLAPSRMGLGAAVPAYLLTQE